MTTADHKVAMYTLAQKRRAAGLPVWDLTVRGFRDALYDNPEDTIAARDALVSAIKASSWYKNADEYNDLWTLIDELIDVGNPAIDWDEGYDAQRHLNGLLDEIYDLADQERVYLT